MFASENVKDNTGYWNLELKIYESEAEENLKDTFGNLKYGKWTGKSWNLRSVLIQYLEFNYGRRDS